MARSVLYFNGLITVYCVYFLIRNDLNYQFLNESSRKLFSQICTFKALIIYFFKNLNTFVVDAWKLNEIVGFQIGTRWWITYQSNVLKSHFLKSLSKIEAELVYFRWGNSRRILRKRYFTLNFVNIVELFIRFYTIEKQIRFLLRLLPFKQTQMGIPSIAVCPFWCTYLFTSWCQTSIQVLELSVVWLQTRV